MNQRETLIVYELIVETHKRSHYTQIQQHKHEKAFLKLRNQKGKTKDNREKKYRSQRQRREPEKLKFEGFTCSRASNEVSPLQESDSSAVIRPYRFKKNPSISQ